MSGFFQRLGEYVGSAAPPEVSLLVSPRMEGRGVAIHQSPLSATVGTELFEPVSPDLEVSDAARGFEQSQPKQAEPMDGQPSEPVHRSRYVPRDPIAEPQVGKEPAVDNIADIRPPVPGASLSDAFREPVKNSASRIRESLTPPPEKIGEIKPPKGNGESPLSIDLSYETERAAEVEDKPGADSVPSARRRSSSLPNPVELKRSNSADTTEPNVSRLTHDKPLADQVSEISTTMRDAPVTARSPKRPEPASTQGKKFLPPTSPIEASPSGAIDGMEISKPRVTLPQTESRIQPLVLSDPDNGRDKRRPASTNESEKIVSQPLRERPLETGLSTEALRKPAALSPSEAPLVRAADLMGIAEALWAENMRDSQSISPASTKRSERSERSERSAAPPAEANREPDTIHVTIGRVIVRAPTQAAPARPAPAAPPSGVSLKDYLQSRSGRRR